MVPQGTDIASGTTVTPKGLYRALGTGPEDASGGEVGRIGDRAAAGCKNPPRARGRHRVGAELSTVPQLVKGQYFDRWLHDILGYERAAPPQF